MNNLFDLEIIDPTYAGYTADVIRGAIFNRRGDEIGFDHHADGNAYSEQAVYQVTLSGYDGTAKNYLRSRIVALCAGLIDSIDSPVQVRHINEKERWNDSISNLKVVYGSRKKAE